MNGIDNDILRYDHDDDCHGHYHQHHHMTFVENVHFQQRKQKKNQHFKHLFIE